MVESAREEVLYSGRVQGVGFRWTAANIARQFAVTGYVRNRSDGRVELVAEGTPAELDRFFGAIRAEMAEKIDNETRNRTVATRQFADFAIQR